MLMPKRVKHRKQHRGRMRGLATRGNIIDFGDYGIMALEPCWVTSRQIEAARIAMTRHIKRGGQVWIRIFPDKPITKKPLEQRMGKGKAPVEGWVAVVKPGRILFEMDGVPVDVAREAMRLAIHKLPMACKFVTKSDFAQGNPLEARKLVARHGQEFVDQMFAGKNNGAKAEAKAKPVTEVANVTVKAEERAPAEEPMVEDVMVVEDEVPTEETTVETEGENA